MKASEAVRLNMTDLDCLFPGDPDYYGGNPYWDDGIPSGDIDYPQIDERPDDERDPGDSTRTMAVSGDYYRWS